MAGEVYDAALAGLTADEKRALVKGLTAIITNLSDGETPACRTNKYRKRQCSMNAVAKVNDDVTKVELDKPAEPPAASPQVVALRTETPAQPGEPRSAGAAAFC